MSALKVLTFGVSLVLGLQAWDDPGTDFAARQIAAAAALDEHDYARGIQIFEECALAARTDRERTAALAGYGIALRGADRDREARVALEKALAGWPEADVSDGREERGAVAAVLAAADRKVGDYAGAEEVLQTALGKPGNSSAIRAILVVNLADLLREQARIPEAWLALRQSGDLTGLPLMQQLGVKEEMAELMRDSGNFNASVALWNQVMEIAVGAHSVRLEAVAAGGLGETWFAVGNVARAEPLLRRSLQLLREDSETKPSQLAVALALMGRVYITENKLALAGDALDEAIQKDEKSLGPTHPQIAVLLELKADTESRRGEPQEARDELERAQTIMSGHFGAESTAGAGVLAELGDVEVRANEPKVAVLEYEKALTMLREQGDERWRLSSGIIARYAAALKAVHRGDEAKQLLKSISTVASGGKSGSTTIVAGAQSFREK